jgi:hypothetical protein
MNMYDLNLLTDAEFAELERLLLKALREPAGKAIIRAASELLDRKAGVETGDERVSP